MSLALKALYFKAKPGTPVSLRVFIASSNSAPLFGSTFVNLHMSVSTDDKGDIPHVVSAKSLPRTK